MIKRINFFTHKVTYRIVRKRNLSQWLEGVIESYGKITGDINIVLVSDKYLKKLNYKYLGKKTYTDTISFSLSEEASVISGDVYVSIHRIKENAKLFGSDIKEELSRVMVHSVLHLLGIEDETEEDQRLMRALENKYLKRLRRI